MKLRKYSCGDTLVPAEAPLDQVMLVLEGTAVCGPPLAEEEEEAEELVGTPRSEQSGTLDE